MIIYKYPMSINNKEHTFLMPADARFLSLQIQDGQACMWMLCHDHDTPKVARKFVSYMTGEDFDHDNAVKAYIGTVQLDGVSYVPTLVLHVFECLR